MSEVADDEQWFAMRATYGRNLMAQNVLNEHGVRTFIPMHYTRSGNHRRNVPRLTPVIRDLIFVMTNRETIATLKKNMPYLHYIMRDEGMRREPVIVPERQMQQFIAVSGTLDEQLMWFSPGQLDMKCGDAVRIIGGPFAGLEGILMKVPGKRSRCVVVAVQGVIAVAMATVHPDMIEPVEKKNDY